MCAFVFAQVARVGACELAEAAFVRLLAIVEGANVRLQLGVRCRGVTAAVANVRPLTCVGAFVVVLCLVSSEHLITSFKAASIRAMTGVA